MKANLRPWLLSPLILLPASQVAVEKRAFIVHEWGVQVIGRAHGGQILTAPEELLAGLPKFVGRNETPLRFEAHGWDKPVIHFYGTDGMEVSVKIETPTGAPIAYFPHPHIQKGKMWGSSRKKMIAGMFHFQSGVEWKGRLRKKAPANLPRPPDGHWWNDARAIPSAYIETERGSDRFLFYEATAAQPPVVTTRISRDAVELKNALRTPVGPIVILVNDGTRLRGIQRDEIPAGETTRIPSAALEDWSHGKALAVCRQQWVALGMTKKEAAGIVRVWRRDLVDRLGVLVVSPMPQGTYDEMFPITVAPKPDEIVRAGLVFDALPGQGARQHWLPGLQATLRKLGPHLSSDHAVVRRDAERAFRNAGELAAAVLAELAESDDAELRRGAKAAQNYNAPRDAGLDFVRPKDRSHAARLVEHFWPPKKIPRD